MGDVCDFFTKGSCSTVVTINKFTCVEPTTTSTKCDYVKTCAGQANCANVKTLNKGFCFLYGSTCEERDCAKASLHLGVPITNPT